MDDPSYTVTSFPNTLNASCHALSWIKSMHLHEYHPSVICNCMALQLQLHLLCSLLLSLTLHRHRLVVCKCTSVHLCNCAFVHLCTCVLQPWCASVHLCNCAFVHLCIAAMVCNKVWCASKIHNRVQIIITQRLTGLWCALHHCKCNKALQQRVWF